MPSSSSDRLRLTPVVRGAPRRTWHHLAATLVVAGLAVTGSVLGLEGTGALYTADASATMTGFRAAPVCDAPDVPTAQSVLAGLGPELHWGFAPDVEPAPWTSSVGDPSPSPPDGPLACDDGVLDLVPGQAVWAPHALPAASTIVLVLDRPATGGTVVTITADDDVGLDVVVSGATVSLRSWTTPDAVSTVASAPLGDGTVHVLAVTLDGAGAALWVAGQTVTGALATPVAGDVQVGLGTPGPVPTGAPVPTATFTATELAIVAGTLDPAVLTTLAEAALPALP